MRGGTVSSSVGGGREPRAARAVRVPPRGGLAGRCWAVPVNPRRRTGVSMKRKVRSDRARMTTRHQSRLHREAGPPGSYGRAKREASRKKSEKTRLRSAGGRR